MSVPETPLLYLVPHLDLPADPNLLGPDLPADPNLLLFPTLPPSTSPQILPPTASEFPLIPKMDPRQLRSNISNKDKLCTN